MRNIPIQAVPNQEFSVTIEDNRWTLRIKIAVTSMFADVYLNEEVVILGQRIAPGTPVIPYDYLANAGNFILVVENGDLPDWQKFGVTQSLFYVAPGELAERA